MYQVINYNTGNNPNPEVLFSGSKSDCEKYVVDKNIPMEGDKNFPSGVGVEIIEDADDYNNRKEAEHYEYLDETLEENGDVKSVI